MGFAPEPRERQHFLTWEDVEDDERDRRREDPDEPPPAWECGPPPSDDDMFPCQCGRTKLDQDESTCIVCDGIAPF